MNGFWYGIIVGCCIFASLRYIRDITVSKLKEEAVTTNRALSDVALSHMLEAKRKERLRSAQLGHLQGELNNARKKLQLIEGKFDTPEGRAEQVLVNEREWHDA